MFLTLLNDIAELTTGKLTDLVFGISKYSQ